MKLANSKMGKNDFIQFVIYKSSNRVYIFIFLVTVVSLFWLFKLFYPHPSMVMDSYIYIRAAVSNVGADRFPIGYSKFLQLFGSFSNPATLIVWTQFIVLESALFMFFFTIRYFFRPSKMVSVVLFGFFFCNPILFFLCNFIMSDALFTALSIFWINQLIWMIYRPRGYMIYLQAILLLLSFTIRYGAYYYPIVSTVALFWSGLPVKSKIAGFIFQLFLLFSFVQYTRSEMRKMTGVAQFSPVGGWHIANNALYMYGHINYEWEKPVPLPFQSLDSMVRRYFATAHSVEGLLDSSSKGNGDYYENDDGSPLRIYMDNTYGNKSFFGSFRSWGRMGELCSRYGTFLIRRHPFEYIKYYMWPNSIRYLCPPNEIFASSSPYIMREDSLGITAMIFLHINTLSVGKELIEARTELLSNYPVIFTLANVLFVVAFIGLYLLKGFKKQNKSAFYVFNTTALLWALNLCFSSAAASVFLRYQIFPMIFQIVFGLMLIEIIYNDGYQQGAQIVKK